MSGIVDTVGLISGIVTIVSFTLSNSIPSQRAGGAVVGVGVGLGNSPTEPGNMDGSVQAIYGFDANNDYLGVSDTDIHVERGGYAEIQIHQELGETVQARKINFVNSDDAMCIQYLSVTQVNDYKTVWTGDVGYHCGQASWYPGKQAVGRAEDGTEYKPGCVWLDGNLEADAMSASLKFDIGYYYANPDGSHTSEQEFCDGTQWSTSQDPMKKGKRAFPSPRDLTDQVLRDGWLVVNSDANQPASWVCNSDTSFGPDYVNLPEGMFCDMGTHTLYPLCSTTDDDADCFDLELAETGTEGALTRRDAPGSVLLERAPPTFNYTAVEHW
ncbi:hypothetical protein BDY21DRAFT_365656 [Lineolata rhizophorae]|uniref:Uncharacterized protein n=1 Tax=Lineolata rhizophorae TaxID=578093 RepID=A0A6A6NTC6_9PEZI|nr:hypothetical protein BDY21DRAFT_365656 [Lineolata rhizophorae]